MGFSLGGFSVTMGTLTSFSELFMKPTLLSSAAFLRGARFVCFKSFFKSSSFSVPKMVFITPENSLFAS